MYTAQGLTLRHARQYFERLLLAESYYRRQGVECPVSGA